MRPGEASIGLELQHRVRDPVVEADLHPDLEGGAQRESFGAFDDPLDASGSVDFAVSSGLNEDVEDQRRRCIDLDLCRQDALIPGVEDLGPN